MDLYEISQWKALGMPAAMNLGGNAEKILGNLFLLKVP